MLRSVAVPCLVQFLPEISQEIFHKYFLPAALLRELKSECWIDWFDPGEANKKQIRPRVILHITHLWSPLSLPARPTYSHRRRLSVLTSPREIFRKYFVHKPPMGCLYLTVIYWLVVMEYIRPWQWLHGRVVSEQWGPEDSQNVHRLCLGQPGPARAS